MNNKLWLIILGFPANVFVLVLAKRLLPPAGLSSAGHSISCRSEAAEIPKANPSPLLPAINFGVHPSSAGVICRSKVICRLPFCFYCCICDSGHGTCFVMGIRSFFPSIRRTPSLKLPPFAMEPRSLHFRGFKAQLLGQ